jgi:uncharacterized membrane protein
MLSVVLQVVYFLAIPLVAIEMAKRYRVFEWLNPVVFCYAAGILLLNTPAVAVHAETAKTTTEASILLAIPLVLFASNIKAWLAQSRTTVISFVCATVAVCVSSYLAATHLNGLVEEAPTVSGMLVGVYTGGTPNMMSIGKALGAQEETFALLIASDLVVGGVYLLFLLTLAKPLLKHVFPAYVAPEGVEEIDIVDEHFDWRGAVAQMAIAFGISVLVVALSAGVTLLIAGELAVAGIFLGITTGGILCSTSAKIRSLRGSYELGNYFILVFCVAMGAQTDLSALVASGSSVLLYTVVVITGSLLLHFVLARIFGVDVDTLIITSTAAVYGPAFIGPIAEAIDNRQMILSGLTAGLVGYAVGNYLGIGLAYMLGG